MILLLYLFCSLVTIFYLIFHPGKKNVKLMKKLEQERAHADTYFSLSLCRRKNIDMKMSTLLHFEHHTHFVEPTPKPTMLMIFDEMINIMCLLMRQFPIKSMINEQMNTHEGTLDVYRITLV